MLQLLCVRYTLDYCMHYSWAIESLTWKKDRYNSCDKDPEHQRLSAAFGCENEDIQLICWEHQ